jgi:MoaA/NifB/PqqE/SkfB family radical SAM enzyme
MEQYNFKRHIAFLIFSQKMPFRLPESVRLDASTLCQLNCVDCYMRKENYCGLGAGYLKYADFVKFLEMNPFVKKIELSNSGEMFMNPDLLKIIEYAHQKGIRLIAFNGVNFNSVSDEMLEALVKFQFYGLNLSIDGASQEVYVKYRRGGNFDKVIANIKKVNAYKEQYHSAYPILRWQYIVMEQTDNENEMRKAYKMAKELNMRMFYKQDWSGYVPKNRQVIEELTGDLRTEISISENVKWVPCCQLWLTPQINWNGRFLACCCGMNEFDINVFETGLEKCLKSKLIKNSKRMLMTGISCEESACYKCWFYKQIEIENNFITSKEILEYAKQAIDE